MQLCRSDGALAAEVDVNAAALLMGIADSEREFCTQLPDLLLVNSALLTTSIEYLLAKAQSICYGVQFWPK